MRMVIWSAPFVLIPSRILAQAPSAEQLRSIQQKEFGAEKAAVFGSIVDVLQDLGSSIASADIATGFISTESATGNKPASGTRWVARRPRAISGRRLSSRQCPKQDDR